MIAAWFELFKDLITLLNDNTEVPIILVKLLKIPMTTPIHLCISVE